MEDLLAAVDEIQQGMEQVDAHGQLLQALIEQNNAIATRAERQEWRERVSSCDGTDAESLKQWLLDLTAVPVDHRGAVMLSTARGMLLRSLQEYHQQHAGDNGALQWDAVRQYVIATFIAPDHAAVLERELTSMTKQPFETPRIFSQRFRLIADMVYPPGNRQPFQHRKLIETYCRALADVNLQKRIARGGIPDTIDDAINRALTVDVDADAFRQLTGKEHPDSRRAEPMEIGTMISALRQEIAQLNVNGPPPRQPQPPLETQRLQTEVTKLKAEVQRLKQKQRPTKTTGATIQERPRGSSQSTKTSVALIANPLLNFETNFELIKLFDAPLSTKNIAEIP